MRKVGDLSSTLFVQEDDTEATRALLRGLIMELGSRGILSNSKSQTAFPPWSPQSLSCIRQLLFKCKCSFKWPVHFMVLKSCTLLRSFWGSPRRGQPCCFRKRFHSPSLVEIASVLRGKQPTDQIYFTSNFYWRLYFIQVLKQLAVVLVGVEMKILLPEPLGALYFFWALARSPPSRCCVWSILVESIQSLNQKLGLKRVDIDTTGLKTNEVPFSNIFTWLLISIPWALDR